MVCVLILVAAYVATSQDYTFNNVVLTGVVTAPTQTPGNNTTRLATTAFVTAAVSAGGGGTLTASGGSLPANQIMLGNTYPDTKPLGSLGTTTTVLHGNAGGAPSFGAVALATDVSGQLPIAAVGSAGLSGTSPIAISSAGAISCATCNVSTATVSSIATTSPITGGTITTTGTIACATCVAASSPGVGIAHFAGSTQTVTSSLIVAADITNAAITGTQLASSLALTTPNIGAATGTSLLVTSNLDGTAPVIVTTGTTGTPGATFNHSYSFNEEATAGTGVNYTLPTAAAGKQYCIANANNGSAANTGVLTITTSASGQFIIFTDGTLSATGGNVTSGGAAADAACVVGVDSTHWLLYVQSGTWTKH